MFTVLLLLTFSDTPTVTPAELVKIEAREAENMAKFKADMEKKRAREGEVKRAIAEREAKIAAKIKLVETIKKYGPAGKPLTVKEKTKLMYQKRNQKPPTKK